MESYRHNPMFFAMAQEETNSDSNAAVDDADTSDNPAKTEPGESQQKISVSFSLWDHQQQQQPENVAADDDSDAAVIEAIFTALQDFFCEDTELVVVNENYKNVCSRTSTSSSGGNVGELSSIGTTTDTSDSGSSSATATDAGDNASSSSSSSSTGSLIADFLADSNEPDSYVSDEVESLYVTNTMRTSDNSQSIEWSTWSIFYNVVYIGTTFSEQAATMNVSDELEFMEDSVQLALDVSIMEGIMDTRLEGTGLQMSMVGQEVNTFEDSMITEDQGNEELESEDVNRSQEFDVENKAQLLRWIGVGLLVVNVAVFVVLTTLGKRHRKKKMEEENLLDHDLEGNQGLCTEKDVEHMLEVSRRHSSQLFSARSFSQHPDSEESEIETQDSPRSKDRNVSITNLSVPKDTEAMPDPDHGVANAGNVQDTPIISSVVRSLSDLFVSTGLGER
ncbi:MAG: hypothetical protein SGILL_000023 [Bacillariaceae sp.]